MGRDGTMLKRKRKVTDEDRLLIIEAAKQATGMVKDRNKALSKIYGYSESTIGKVVNDSKEVVARQRTLSKEEKALILARYKKLYRKTESEKIKILCKEFNRSTSSINLSIKSGTSTKYFDYKQPFI